jgi:ElaB/YqjD/DUF883 family membrane-anchored ribosome-binding protein
MAFADLKTVATEKIDDSVQAAKRVIRQRTNDLEDLRDAAALKIRRAPIQTVAIAASAGILLGFVIGAARGRARASRIKQM